MFGATDVTFQLLVTHQLRFSPDTNIIVREQKLSLAAEAKIPWSACTDSTLSPELWARRAPQPLSHNACAMCFADQGNQNTPKGNVFPQRHLTCYHLENIHRKPRLLKAFM
jgi:hypothetical protein